MQVHGAVTVNNTLVLGQSPPLHGRNNDVHHVSTSTLVGFLQRAINSHTIDQQIVKSIAEQLKRSDVM